MEFLMAALMGLGSMIGGWFGGSKSNRQNVTYSAPTVARPKSASMALQMPKAPDALADGEDNAGAKAMEKAAEDERKAAAARAAASNDIFTSPLGVVGEANVYRKKLLGVS